MYNKILEDIKREYYQREFPNDGQRFVAWYLRNIYDLNTFEAKDCVTDGSNDKQIDAVYIDDREGVIHIIQGKFYSCDEVNSDPIQEVITSWMRINDLKALQENANHKLKVKINEIRRALEDDYSFSFELLMTSKLSLQAEKDFEYFRRFISENEDLKADFFVVDNEMLKKRYNEALNKLSSYINYDFSIDSDKCMTMNLNGTKVIVAAVSLKECVDIPGIKDGSLFVKNVRQSLGRNNKVNKGIAKTIKDDAGNFFFCHNGITAICSNAELSNNGKLSVENINVVNGCQSLNTIFECGESARKSTGYILFKFYVITDNEKINRISSNTNSQSAVKARDLRSNDKIVLRIKKTYEQAFPEGYFITKRGEIAGSCKNKKYVNDLTSLGKELIAWHCQRPNLSYGETRIFDTYFSQLFHEDYKAEDMQALKEMFDATAKFWDDTSNPLEINETLLAMRAYGPYHHLYAVSALTNIINKKIGKIPSPSKIYQKLKNNSKLDKILKMTGKGLNAAFEKANEDAISSNKIFAPQNWIKSKASVKEIEELISAQISNLGWMDGGAKELQELKDCMKLEDSDFSDRYSAD